MRNEQGSRDYDNYLVCLDIETGKELWRRKESKLGNLRGGKRPTSIDFDLSGDLIVGWDYLVGEGNYEVVSKHSAKDGAIIWEWKALSEGARSSGTGYSHGAWIFCDGTEQSRKWRVVEVTNESRIGRTLAHGTGISHNYAGPIRLTKRGSVVVSGSLTQNQCVQSITVWK